MTTWLLVGVLACGGSKEADPEPTPESSEAATEANAPAAPDNTEAEEAEPESREEPKIDPDLRACIDDCQKARMAEAVDWSVIELQCQMQCDGTAPSLEDKAPGLE